MRASAKSLRPRDFAAKMLAQTSTKVAVIGAVAAVAIRVLNDHELDKGLTMSLDADASRSCQFISVIARCGTDTVARGRFARR